VLDITSVWFDEVRQNGVGTAAGRALDAENWYGMNRYAIRHLTCIPMMPVADGMADTAGKNQTALKLQVIGLILIV
jgi:hypothetical protein